jgi:hypothetical protein
MDFLKDIGITLHYKGSGGSRLSFYRETEYTFSNSGITYQLIVSRLDELKITYWSQNSIRHTIYCIFTDKKHMILMILLRENSYEKIDPNDCKCGSCESCEYSVECRIIDNEIIKSQVVDFVDKIRYENPDEYINNFSM